ncbi:MAG: glycosyltransferase [Leeuwenhoekiella sp.]
MPKFSVVIPVYNKRDFLRKTLKSVYDQTYTDYEIIAVNDGSTDGSDKILKDFNSEKLKVIDQHNQGLSAARNTGIKNATGEIIAFLDADDLWQGNHLQVIDKLAQDFPEADLYAAAYSEIYGNGLSVIPNLNIPKTIPNNGILISNFFKASLHQPLINMNSFALKKVCFDELAGFDRDITYAEDTDFLIRANLKFKLAYSPKLTSCYHTEISNQISQQSRKQLNPPDYAKYVFANPENISLYQYINRKRYFLAIEYKCEGSAAAYAEIKELIDSKFLTWKQRMLLMMPKKSIILLKKIKQYYLKRGKRITTF